MVHVCLIGDGIGYIRVSFIHVPYPSHRVVSRVNHFQIEIRITIFGKSVHFN